MMINTLKKIFFSTRLTALLFIVFAAAMGLGTFIESWYSIETAKMWIYNARWFEAIMLFFVINFVGNISRYKLLRKEKWPTLILHLSWILIIIGAAVTRYIGYEGVMPIREGNSEKVFYSDKTYLTALVDGDIDGELHRRKFQDDIIVTPEALKSSLPWNFNFNGTPFTISYVDFIKGAKEGLVPSEDGKEFLKIVEAGNGERHDHYLESGKIANIHNILFALDTLTNGAINIFTKGDTYQIKAPFEGDFMRMADQFQGKIEKDSLQTLQLRSLYNMAGMQFVIPEPLVKGEYGIVALPKEEVTKQSQDALIVDITANGKIALQNRKIAFKQAEIDYQKARLEMESYLWTEEEYPLEIQENIQPQEIITKNTIDTVFKLPKNNQELQALINNHPKITLLNQKIESLSIERRLKIRELFPKLKIDYNFISPQKKAKC